MWQTCWGQTYCGTGLELKLEVRPQNQNMHSKWIGIETDEQNVLHAAATIARPTYE